MRSLLLSVVPAIWVVAIAIVSVQNATPIVVNFLTFESVQIPFGVILSFCVAIGMAGGGLLLSLFKTGQPTRH